MAGTKKTKFSPELKARAVEMVTTYESAVIVGKYLGVPVQLVRDWKFEALQAMCEIVEETCEKLPAYKDSKIAEQKFWRMAENFHADLALFYDTIPDLSTKRNIYESKGE